MALLFGAKTRPLPAALLLIGFASASALLAPLIRTASRGAAAFVFRRGSGSRSAMLFCGAALFAPLGWPYVRLITSGSFISAHPMLPALRLGLVMLAGLALVILAQSWRRPRWILVALGATAAVVINQKVFVAQYPEIHLVVAALGLLGSWLISRIVLQRLWLRRPRLGVAALVGVVLWALASHGAETPRALSGSERWSALIEGFIASTWSEDEDADLSLIEGDWGRMVSGQKPPRPAKGAILITLDTLRARSVGHLGSSEGDTPFLDELATKGVVFSRCYAQSSHSLPSIYSMFTGRYPGALSIERSSGQVEHEPTLAGTLSRAGRRSVALPGFHSGEMRTARAPFSKGFDVYRQRRTRSRPTSQESLDAALQELRSETPPGFLWVHLMDIHGPYGHIENTLGRGELAHYRAAIRVTDAALRAFFAKGRAEGLLDDRLIVIHSDHGEEFGEHGGRYHGSSLYEEQIHVPLLVLGPKLGQHRIDRPVELVDIKPTVLDFLELPAEAALHGDSLLPELLGDTTRAGLALSQLPSRGYLYPELFTLIIGQDKLIAPGAGRPVQRFDLERDPDEKAPETAPDDALMRKMIAARALASKPPPGGGAPPPLLLVEGAPDDEEVRTRLLAEAVDEEAIEIAFRRDAHLFRAAIESRIDRIETLDSAAQRLLALVVRRRVRGFGAALLRLVQRLDRIADVESVLDTFGESAVKEDAAEFRRLSPILLGRHPTLAPRLLGLALRLGEPGSDDLLLSLLPKFTQAQVAAVYGHAAYSETSIARELLIGELLASPEDIAFNGFALGLLSRAQASCVAGFFDHLRAQGKLPPGVDTLALGQGESIAGFPRGLFALARIAELAAPRERGRALGLLGRNEAPGAVLDRIAESRRTEAQLPPPQVVPIRPRSSLVLPYSGGLLLRGERRAESTSQPYRAMPLEARDSQGRKIPGTLLELEGGRVLVGLAGVPAAGSLRILSKDQVLFEGLWPRE